MKLLTTAIVGMLVASGAIASDASSCYNIADQDRRTACLAKAHSDPGRCYAIKDQQLRAECRAETSK